jgi:electron transport complex protein RnfE
MDLLFGSIAANWDVSVFSENYSFLLFALPSGAFIVLGLLMALKNATINITVFHGRDSG